MNDEAIYLHTLARPICWVLNVSISHPFFKGKPITRGEAFNLLHQLSNIQYIVNTQDRIET